MPGVRPTTPFPPSATLAPAPPPKASVDDSALAVDGHPLAGYHNGLFYLRDPYDNFRLYVQGRAQIDAYTYAGPGVSDTTLKPTLFLRRIRPEITGELFHCILFSIAGDFGATALDNPKGTTEISAAAPGAAPTASSGRYASAETTKLSAAPTDVFITVKAHDLLNAQIGQFDAPFTMENRTSDKFIPFTERSLAVRAVGIPTNKEIGLMLWGEMPNKLLYYFGGVFDGDGQNRLNTDSRGEVIGRVFLHPLFMLQNVLKTAQIGGSVLYGSRDKTFTDYDYPALSTQGNFSFWSPTYTGAGGPTHIIPAGDQVGGAAELVPFSLFDVTSEFVYVNNGTREAIEGFEATNSERFGAMKGFSYYVEVGVWPIGPRDLNGLPGYENNPHVDFSKADPVDPAVAVQVVAKWEQVHLNYASAARSGTPDAKNIDGTVNVDAFSLAANLWVTKHCRFAVDYVLDVFPGSEPVSATTKGGVSQTKDQRAIAPAQTLSPGVDNDARQRPRPARDPVPRVGRSLMHHRCGKGAASSRRRTRAHRPAIAGHWQTPGRCPCAHFGNGYRRKSREVDSSA